MRLIRVWLPLVIAIGAGSVHAQGRPSLDKVLYRWVQAYEKGRLKLTGFAVVGGEADPIYGVGWLTHQQLDQTHRAGLITLLERATRKPTVLAAQQVLRLAAMGLLDGKATLRRTHFAVRLLGKLALHRFTATETIFFLMQVADGDMSGFRRKPKDTAGFRAAAILALGGMGKPVVRPTLQKQLRSEHAVVRLATAEALQEMQHPRTLDDLAAAMRVESDAIVALALVRSVRAVLLVRGKEVDNRGRQSVVNAAVGLLGRTDWRTDLEIVELFGKIRSAATIEPLIAILDREPRTEGFSRRLREAAGETLRSLTGAIIPIDEPGEWRDYWKKVADTFVVVPVKAIDPARTAAGFFGLPVRGSNVVFIIDTSGSMSTEFFPAGEFEPDLSKPVQTRMSVAKSELLKAVRGLPMETRFNVIAFATNVKPWRSKLVRGTNSARTALTRSVRRMEPLGATNIFGGLDAALGIKTLSYGARYETAVDEIFLLSDGEPTAGKVVDTVTILQLIEATNRYSSVRINTIYMGGGGGSVFMETLAKQNGGRYVRL
jgi:von Willebrand factor type A domain/HEAT repeats